MRKLRPLLLPSLLALAACASIAAAALRAATAESRAARAWSICAFDTYCASANAAKRR